VISAFAFADGARITGTAIYCDPPRRPRAANPLCFLSSARSLRAGAALHTGRARVVATQRTLALGRAAGGRAIPDALPVQLCRPFSLGRLRIELLPSGHLPGAAQLLVSRDGGPTVLYAGIVAAREGGRLAEPIQARACEAIAVAAPLVALTDRALPPRADVEASLVTAVTAARREGRAVEVRAARLGAAAEVAKLVPQVTATAPRLRRILAAYRRLGLLGPVDADGGPPVRLLDESEPFSAGVLRIAVGGEALAGEGAVGADLALPLSDEADLPSLVAHVAACGAREVYVTTALPPAAAEALAGDGRRVRRLAPPAQIPLAI
jgi:hypothetical protein